MKAEYKAKWLKALRSGKRKQGSGSLKQTGAGGVAAYCCLGVLACDVLGKRGHKTPQGDFRFFGGEYAYLPSDVLDEVGLPPEVQRKLAEMNDSGKSFAEIADYIEENL